MKTLKLILICTIAILMAPQLLAAQTYVNMNTESASARAHFVKAMKALDANRGDDARAHFDMAIKADGNFAAAHHYRANVSTGGADFAKHHEHALALRESASSFVQIQIDIAQAGLENDTEKQMMLTRNLVAMYPGNARAHVELGNMYQFEKRIAEARTEYRAAVDLDGAFALARKALSSSFLFDEPKNTGLARRYAQNYLNRAADEPDAYILLGDVFRAQDDFERARDTYVQATELDSKHSVAHSKIGHANTFLGDYNAARGNFTAAAEANRTIGGKANMHNFGVFTYLYTGDIEGGLAANEEVIQNMVASSATEDEKTFPIMTAYWQRAMMAMHHGQNDVAEAALNSRAEWVEKAKTQINNPSWSNGINADIVVWNGMLAARRGDLKKARQLAAENMELLKDETNPRRYENYHQLLAAIESADGNHSAAVEHLAHANVDWILIKYEAAEANAKAGNIDKARELYEEVASWNFNGIMPALCRNDAAKKLTEAPMSIN